jgi:acyl-homoserine-lactone acylase
MLPIRLIACTLLGSTTLFAKLPAQASPQVAKQSSAQQARWQATAKRVTIMRDK